MNDTCYIMPKTEFRAEIDGYAFDDNDALTFTHKQDKTNDKISLACVLKSISDEISLSIFKAIADANYNGTIHLRKLNLTHKRYYSRMNQLTRAGLTKRKSGSYFLTRFGKVIYCCLMISQSALNDYYKLKAIESVEDSDFSKEDFVKLVDTLIDNPKIKEFLTMRC